jgi:hypothetical protein
MDPTSKIAIYIAICNGKFKELGDVTYYTNPQIAQISADLSIRWLVSGTAAVLTDLKGKETLTPHQ